MNKKIKRKIDLIKTITYWLVSIALLMIFLFIPMEKEYYIAGLVMCVIALNINVLITICYILDL